MFDENCHSERAGVIEMAARAKAIEASVCSYEQKLELIGKYLFNDPWDIRPTQPSPEHVTDPQVPGSRNILVSVLKRE